MRGARWVYQAGMLEPATAQDYDGKLKHTLPNAVLELEADAQVDAAIAGSGSDQAKAGAIDVQGGRG